MGEGSDAEEGGIGVDEGDGVAGGSFFWLFRGCLLEKREFTATSSGGGLGGSEADVVDAEFSEGPVDGADEAGVGGGAVETFFVFFGQFVPFGEVEAGDEGSVDEGIFDAVEDFGFEFGGEGGGRGGRFVFFAGLGDGDGREKEDGQEGQPRT